MDEERRRLEKLEQDLTAADPDLDRKLQSGLTHRQTAAGSVYAIGAALAGLALSSRAASPGSRSCASSDYCCWVQARAGSSATPTGGTGPGSCCSASQSGRWSGLTTEFIGKGLSQAPGIRFGDSDVSLDWVASKSVYSAASAGPPAAFARRKS